MTSKIESWRAAAQAAAVSNSASPGKGTPALSTRMPMPANGPPSTSTREGQSTRVHILDDPMPDYGEHDATDDPLQVLRHSTAHLLAAAVVELYPEAKYGIGPAVQDGFYYDFDFGGKSISEADLPAIESRMRRLAQADVPFVHEVLPRKQAIEEFVKRDQIYKLELIHDKVEGDEVSVYRTGEFLDLCRGPHVRSTKDLKAFKLMRVAGAYWRGGGRKTHLAPTYRARGREQRRPGDYLNGPRK